MCLRACPPALPCAQAGQKIKDALHAQSAAPVVVELDWKESVLHEDDRCAAHTIDLPISRLGRPGPAISGTNAGSTDKEPVSATL